MIHKLITTILRTGKRPSGQEIVMILQRIIERIRKVWPYVGIIVRGDSHYGCPEVFDFCNEHNLKYVFGLTGRSPMLDTIRLKILKLGARVRQLSTNENRSDS